ncbi:hypothetical protein BXZ70DRAFT_904435 [Cristinia sonorae]|uniref:DUF6533 domain-containing protein n=1 Tax=Cristinia sonorae TaxID=1940300 RepID=A0A8K0UVY6_9AGAR|nr:hypothetical protein BXZ70DRAFT_904435 [Cristinia sonorae]
MSSSEVNEIMTRYLFLLVFLQSNGAHKIFSSRFTVNCIVAAVTLLAFDFLLTFGRECRCMWRRGLTLVTVIYVLERYCANVYWQRCKQKQITVQVLTMLVIFGIALFTSFRAYAITGRMTLPVLAVFLCGMFSPAANLQAYRILHNQPDAASNKTNSPYVRLPQNYIHSFDLLTVSISRRNQLFELKVLELILVPILVRAIVILGDIIVLAITWSKSFGVFKTSLRLKNFRPKISILLIRDGTLYFVAIALLNLGVLLQVTFSLLLDEHGGTGFIFVADAVTSALISRFILNLRGVVGDASGDDTTPSFTTTVIFATHSFLGNLAAPLHTRVTERSDSETIFQKVKEPFMIDLEPDHGITEAGSSCDDIPLPELKTRQAADCPAQVAV